MQPPIEMRGRVPRVLSTLSNRLFVAVIGLVVILIAAIAYGFHYRSRKQEERQEAQQKELTGSAPAKSNRRVLETEGYKAGLARLQNSRPLAAGEARPVVGGDAASQNLYGTATDAGMPPLSPSRTIKPTTPPYLSIVPAQTNDTTPGDNGRTVEHKDPRDQTARLQAAIEAPTGANQDLQHLKSEVRSSLDDEEARLNERLQQPILPQVNSGARVASPSGLPMASAEESAYSIQNGQTAKRTFQESDKEPADDYLKTTRMTPLSAWVVQRGTVIPATLPHQVVSDLPGDLIAEVARDVFDSPTQSFVLIPAGSRLVGDYNSSVTYGQSRIQVVWTAIYFPDGSHIDLDRLPSHAADGSSGLKDQVDSHLKRLVGGVVLSSMLAAGLQISQNRTNGSVLAYPSTGQVAASAVGTQASELGQQITTRNLNVQPTLKIRPGEIFVVSVTRDMLFSGPYERISVNK
jgi:type IV secretory pathway VirB10-like protein